MSNSTTRLGLIEWVGSDPPSVIRTGNTTNMNILDKSVPVTRNTLANRPVAGTQVADALYFATDKAQYYLAGQTGIPGPSGWQAIATLGSTYGPLSALTVSSSQTIQAGVLALVTATNVTVQLPTPVLGATVGIVADVALTGSSPITVNAAGPAIFGVGTPGSSQVYLGTTNSFVVLSCDGSNWWIVAGQQDSGWVPLTLSGGVSAGSGYTPAVRYQGDMVSMCGVLTGTNITNWATVPNVQPQVLRPTSTANLTYNTGSGLVALSTSGVITTASTQSTLALDSLRYRLN